MKNRYSNNCTSKCKCEEQPNISILINIDSVSGNSMEDVDFSLDFYVYGSSTKKHYKKSSLYKSATGFHALINENDYPYGWLMCDVFVNDGGTCEMHTCKTGYFIDACCVKSEDTSSKIGNYIITFSNSDIFPANGFVTESMLSESVKQLMFSSGSHVTNMPDEEDLTTTGGEFGSLKFKDKMYEPENYSGLGRVYLRKNFLNGRNVLTQSMLQWSNTIYIVRYDYDLQKATIEIPDNCELVFDGGKISNGKVILTNTLVRPFGHITDYIQAEISGNYKEGQILYDKKEKVLQVWTGTMWRNFIYQVRHYDNKLQISYDNGNTWVDITPKFENNLHIAGYYSSLSDLPTNAIIGTVYGVGPATNESGNPSYRFYVYDGTQWVDNGSFTSLSAGVVQETGDSETEVMSQKAVSTKLSDLGQKVDEFNEWAYRDYSEVLVDDDSKILESRDLQGKKTIHTDLEVKGSFKSKELQQLKDALNEKLEWAESSKFSEVLIDENGKVLESRNADGTKNINTDLNFKNIEQLTSVDSMNYIKVLLDKEGKEILAIDKIGNVILNRLVSRCNIIENNNYKGRVLSYLGDSLSSPNNWAKGCENVLNMIIKGSGIGGTSIAGTATTCYHQDSRINALNIDAKVIFIQGGTNDCRFYVKQGEKSKNNYDTTTFWGGFNVMLSKIYYKYLKQSKGFYNNIDYSGVIQVEKPYVKIPIYVILPPTIPVDESDVNNYSDYRDGIALRRQDLIELCELWGLDYVDANQIGYNYMTNESSDVVHGSSNNFFDILGAKVVSKLVEYNSAMTFFDKYAEEMHNIVLVDNSDTGAKVNQTARFNSNVNITFKSLPNSVSVLSNGTEIPITWVDRINNIACKFVMPNNNVNITIN